ncbi:MAG: hypothetical protein ACP6KW_10220 [Candidatus Thorarchaeota archaeon]
MSRATVAVYHLNGCERCAWHTLAIDDWDELELIHHCLRDGRSADIKADIIILTGYATERDIPVLEQLSSRCTRMVGYGTCPYSGGIFGLANQKGADVISACHLAGPGLAVLGCPPDPQELRGALLYEHPEETKNLCKSCSRKMTDDLFYNIQRVNAIEDTETCFNHLGQPCSGVVSGSCAQRCIDFNTPCRGCIEIVEDPTSSMISYFGTMARQVEVATVGNAWTTDKLSDEPDELTEGLVDVVGTFFRFHLATAFSQPGRIPSTGDIRSDIMVGRPIEEAVQIAATIYGIHGISVALNLIEAYEASVEFKPSEETLQLRARLREAQRQLLEAKQQPKYDIYSATMDRIREVAGNEVLSNLFFFGFKTPVEASKSPFETYKTKTFEPAAVSGSSSDEDSKVSFATDERGIIREWSCEL